VIYSRPSKKIKIGSKPCLCPETNFFWQNKKFISQEGPFVKTHSYQVFECSIHHQSWGRRRKEVIESTCKTPMEYYTLNEDEIKFFKNIYLRILERRIAKDEWNKKLNNAFSQEDVESKTSRFIQAGLIYQEEIILQSKSEKKTYILLTDKGKENLKQLLGFKTRQKIIDDCKIMIENTLKDLTTLKISDIQTHNFPKQSSFQLNDKRVELIYRILKEQFNLLNSNSVPYFKMDGNKKTILSSNSENYENICKILIKISEIILQGSIIDTNEFSSFVKISPPKISSLRSKTEKVLGYKLIFFNIKRGTIFGDEKRKNKEFKKEIEQLINELEEKGRDFIVNQIINNRPPDHSIGDCWDDYFKPIHHFITEKLDMSDINEQKTSRNGIRAMLKYIYFKNIKEIINKNWALFFNQKIPDKKDFGNKYDQLNNLRNKLMHPEHQFANNLAYDLKYAFEILQIFYL